MTYRGYEITRKRNGWLAEHLCRNDIKSASIEKIKAEIDELEDDIAANNEFPKGEFLYR